MNPKARRYLLTRQPEPFAWSFQYSGGRWGLMLPRDSGEDARVYHFASPAERAEWLGQNPRRRAVGKRHPLVKAFRQRPDVEGK